MVLVVAFVAELFFSLTLSLHLGHAAHIICIVQLVKYRWAKFDMLKIRIVTKQDNLCRARFRSKKNIASQGRNNNIA